MILPKLNKYISLLVAVIFIASTNAVAIAAIRTGNACPKKGLTQSYSGKLFTCVKQGSKLVWNKGVPIKSATKATPKPMSSTSPNAVSDQINIKIGETCSSAYRGQTLVTSTGAYICKHDEISAFRWYESEIPKVTTSTSPQPTLVTPAATQNQGITPLTKPISFDNLDSYWTSIEAYKKVKEFSAAQPKLSISKTIHLSPNVVNRQYSKYMAGLEDIAQLWAPLYTNPKFHLILFTEKDSEWIDNKQRELMGSALINPTEQLQSYRMKDAGCNVGGFYLPNIILFCVKSDEELAKSVNAEFSALHSFPHEYTHLMGMISSEVSRFQISSRERLTPCWFWEGSATFYGFALGGSTQNNFEKSRLSFLNELTLPYDLKRNQEAGTIRRALLKNDPAIVASLFKELEGEVGPGLDVQNAYALGAMATEVLVAVYGQEGINKLQLEFGQSGNWTGSFYKVFGITVDDFYRKITPYLASQAEKFTN